MKKYNYTTLAIEKNKINFISNNIKNNENNENNKSELNTYIKNEP